jgi:integrase
MASLFKNSVVRNGKRTVYPTWYGSYVDQNGQWAKVKLFTDKTASQRRLQEIQREADQRRAGVQTPQMDAAAKPLLAIDAKGNETGHVADYLANLKRISTPAHHRIVTGMLKTFLELAGWKALREVTEAGAARALMLLMAKGHTVSYVNAHLTRIKAFVNWCVPSRLPLNPLAKLKRGNARKALKRRARRPLAEHELAKLLNACPDDRRLKYAIPAYTGLRRKELAAIVWGDLHLDAAPPFIQLRPEVTKMGEAVALPIHPYIAAELLKLPAKMPGAKLFPSLPEGRTMLRDLSKAGVQQADASGRRADYHGLRHTFAKRLDASGCSHATRRALMRHGAGDLTDGYTLAALAEMYAAVCRLPFPATPAAAQVKTGTTDTADPRWKPIGKTLFPQGHSGAQHGTPDAQPPSSSSAMADAESDHENKGFVTSGHDVAHAGLNVSDDAATLYKIGPRSSVG